MTSTGWLRAGPAGTAAEQLRHTADDFAGRDHVRRHGSQPFTAGAAGISG